MLEELNNIDGEEFQDPKVKSMISTLINIIETLQRTIEELREEKQNLRDEVNRLKGEDGKPTIKASVKKGDISSESERKVPRKKRKKGAKKVLIDQEKIRRYPPDELPSDAIFKGYAEYTVQDIIMTTDNTLFKREVFYSPSENKTYTAPFPSDFTGSFGPSLRSFIICLKNICCMSESKIHDLLKTIPVAISPAQISLILTDNHEPFHQEKRDLFEAALSIPSSYHQIDDTSARVMGENWYTQVVCNENYSFFETTPRKDRVTILNVLLNGSELKYHITEYTFALMETLVVGKKYQNVLMNFPPGDYNEHDFEKHLADLLPNIGPLIKKKIFDAAALSWYHTTDEHPRVTILVCDDAGQFVLISEIRSLCWVHDGRHYKKLTPVVPLHQQKLESFRAVYWQFYRDLLAYTENPSDEKAHELRREFSKIFSTKTGYDDLDKRIEKTKAKEKELLVALEYPFVPLHNNRSELGARVMVRKRDVSLHTTSTKGTQANDTFASLIETAKKLGVNPFQYILDRISKRYEMKSLAEIIKERSLLPELEVSTD